MYHNFLDHLGSAEIITEKADSVAKKEITINDDKREVLLEHPNSEVVFKDIPITENAALKFGVGVKQTAWERAGDGVLFEIIIVDKRSQRHVIFSRFIDPKNNVEDRKWFDYSLGLKIFTRQKVSFVFKTTIGPKGDKSYASAGWSSPQLNMGGGNESTEVEKTNYDFLENLGDADIIAKKPNKVGKREFIINDDRREVLFEYPDSEMVFKGIPVKENSVLKFGIGINQNAWEKAGDGVLFEISVHDATLGDSLLFIKYIDPKNNVEDRKWFDEQIDLRAFAAQYVSLIFKTMAGLHNNAAADVAGWSRPQIVSYSEISGADEPKTNVSISSNGDKVGKLVDTTMLDFGNELHSEHLLEGWSGDVNGKAQDGTTFVWSVGTTSTVQVTISEITNKKLYLRCHPYPSAPNQKIKVSINGEPLTVLKLRKGWAEYNLTIPAPYLKRGINSLTFENVYPNQPWKAFPNKYYTRPLAIAFDYIKINSKTDNNAKKENGLASKLGMGRPKDASQ